MAGNSDAELVNLNGLDGLPVCRHRGESEGGTTCGSPFLEMTRPTIGRETCIGCAVADKTCDDRPEHPACKKPAGRTSYCKHLGTAVRDEKGDVVVAECKTCAGRVMMKVFNCAHGGDEARARHPTTTVNDCRKCPEYEPVGGGAPPRPSVPASRPLPARTLDAYREQPVEQVIEMIETMPPGPWPRVQRREGNKWVDDPAGTWHCWPNVQQAHRILAGRKLRSIGPYQHDRFSGRGVVIAGGGQKYLPSAWVAARKLRHVGCSLPIELWFLGDAEMDPYVRRLFGQLGVECIDARKMSEAVPCRILCGWELKLYATAWSRFREVLFLDADCAPVGNPEGLFDSGPYREFGSVFWPDFDAWELHPGVWEVFGIQYRKERAFESGQYLIDKARTWTALMMSLWYAEHSDFYFGHVYGDKECYHLGWRATGTDYGMPVRGPGWEHSCCIVQHHPDEGRRDEVVFLHRCGDKWLLPGNRFCDSLPDEALHHSFVRDLAGVWSGRLWDNPAPTKDERAAADRLQFSTFVYRRLPNLPAGFRGDERTLELLPGGRIGEGSAECERRWEVNIMPGADGRPKVVLTICSESRPTAHLEHAGRGVWRGRWLEHERCLVEMVEVVSRPILDADGTPDMDVRESSRSRDRDRCVADVLAVLRKYGRTPGRESVAGLVDASPPAFTPLHEILVSESPE